MNPNAFAPAVTLACASRRLVVAQILIQVILGNVTKTMPLDPHEKPANECGTRQRAGKQTVHSPWFSTFVLLAAVPSD